MRRIISWEGEEKVPGIFIEKGALVWDERLPVAINGLHSMPSGPAEDIRREDDGSITADIQIDVDIPDSAEFSIFVNEVALNKEKSVNGFLHITHARAREVFMVPAHEAVGW